MIYSHQLPNYLKKDDIVVEVDRENEGDEGKKSYLVSRSSTTSYPLGKLNFLESAYLTLSKTPSFRRRTLWTC